VRCIRLVSDSETTETIFSTLTGNDGIRVARMATNAAAFECQVGEGGAVEAFTMNLYGNSVVGAGLFLHFVYDGESALSGYANGTPCGSLSLANPPVAGTIARLGASIGAPTNGSTVILSAALASIALTQEDVESEVCQSMAAHDIIPGNYDHLWSFQQDGARDNPAILKDLSQVGNVPMLRVGLGGAERFIADVQFASPVLVEGG
jgi:hypothetical protein